MKTLSLWQPWATLLVTGEKRIETRHWRFTHRGPLLIHAAKRFESAEQELCLREPFASALARHRFGISNLPLGAIVGKVNVVNCLPTHHEYFNGISEQELFFGNYDAGRYGIICDTPYIFDTPIPTRGFQGLWNYDLLEVM